MTDGPRLLALQELDTQLDQMTHQRPRLPEVSGHAAVEAAVLDHQRRIDALRAEVAAAEAEITVDEQRAADIATKRERLEGQLKTIIAPREAEALMHEIAILDGQRDELDDAELVAMERQGAAEGELAMVMAQLADRQTELAVAAEARATAWSSLDGRIAAVRVQRDALAAELPAADLAIYDKARAQFGGVGIARIEGGHCTGCHVDISRGEIDAMRRLPDGELGECPQCYRYLVR